MIEGKSLTKFYNDIPISNAVDFKLANGEIYGVWDPNGTSASAFLALLSGAILPDAGHLRINGFDTATDRVNAARCTGYMPKNFIPYDDMTPEEFLFFIAEARGLDYEDGVRVVQELINYFDLRGRRHVIISHLSKIEKRKLCLAQTLVGDPEILILDDPFAGLIERDAIDIIDRVDLIADSKTVFITCPLPVLRSICDRILVLSEGNLLGIYEASDQMIDQILNEIGSIAEQDSSLAQTHAKKKKRAKRASQAALKRGSNDTPIDRGGMES